MIEYVEVRNTEREIIGIIDTASSIIWHSVFFGVGDFEIYIQATPTNIELLQVNNYITRLDNDEVGIIENVIIAYDSQQGRMITASGRFAKSILDRRLIYSISGNSVKNAVLKGNLETAVRNIIKDNAIACSFDLNRNFGILELGELVGFGAVIEDEMQTEQNNLLEFTDLLLEEYNFASKLVLGENLKFKYIIYNGADRSIDNVLNNDVVIFSQEFDNLNDSNFELDFTGEKNTALIGGEGEGVERFFSILKNDKQGIERKEVFVNASSIKKSFKQTELEENFPGGSFSGLNFVLGGETIATLVVDLKEVYTASQLREKFATATFNDPNVFLDGVKIANLIYGEESKYNLTAEGYAKMLEVDEKEGDYLIIDSYYNKMLLSNGQQQLSTMKKVQSFSGAINTTNGQFQFNEDFNLGDIITIQDNEIDIYANARIVEVTEVQDENGYNAEVVYK